MLISMEDELKEFYNEKTNEIKKSLLENLHISIEDIENYQNILSKINNIKILL